MSTLIYSVTNNMEFTFLNTFRKTMFTTVYKRQIRNKHFLLTYSYIPDILEKRTPYREKHLKNVSEMNQNGKILVAGALQNPVDSAIFVFDVENENEIKSFVQNDPYMTNGLIANHAIRELGVVALPM